jgi:RNA-directed DNA polymerase
MSGLSRAISRPASTKFSHVALMDRVRKRVGDKRVLALVKAFLKAGILTEERELKDTNTGTPQGSILSPLLSNVALSVLDEHIVQAPGRPAELPAGPKSCGERQRRS